MRCLALLAVVVTAEWATAQGVPDRVVYRDGDRLVTLAGTTTATPEGVTVKAGAESTLVPVQSIVRVDYGNLPGVPPTELASAQGLEQSPDADGLAKAQAAYAALLAKAGSAPESTRNHLAYRVAVVATRLVDRKPLPEFQSEAPAVAEQLEKVALQSAGGWEGWPAARTAARLRAELGQAKESAAILQKLAGNKGLSREQKQLATLAAAATLVRAGDDGFRALVGQVEQEGATDGVKDMLAVLKVADQPVLKAAVDAATGPAAKGVGYTLLGRQAESAGKPREALWHYLWTESVYPDDADALIAASHAIVRLFEKQGDAGRAEEFRGRLPEVRRTLLSELR